jgi:hypothetical protein
MNERIKQLLNRSGGEFYEGFLGSPNTIKFTEEELKTFTELIVGECAGFADEHNDFSEGVTLGVGRALKEHFGVEE